MNLSVTIAQAARFDDADIVVDLSGITFMDASTLGALVVARDHLRARYRSLYVRNPSPPARRLLHMCGLAGMIDEPPVPARPVAATALGSWVDVPIWERGPDSAPVPVAHEAPASAPATRAVEPTELVQQRRAS